MRNALSKAEVNSGSTFVPQDIECLPNQNVVFLRVPAAV